MGDKEDQLLLNALGYFVCLFIHLFLTALSYDIIVINSLNVLLAFDILQEKSLSIKRALYGSDNTISLLYKSQ